MPISLPGTNRADTIYTVTLEGQGYDIRLRWNNRSDSWFIYLGFLGTTPAFKSRMTTNTDILEPYQGRLGVPPGRLFVVDTEKSFGRPSKNNLGINKRFELLYYRSGEPNPFDT